MDVTSIGDGGEVDSHYLFTYTINMFINNYLMREYIKIYSGWIQLISSMTWTMYVDEYLLINYTTN